MAVDRQGKRFPDCEVGARDTETGQKIKMPKQKQGHAQIFRHAF